MNRYAVLVSAPLLLACAEHRLDSEPGEVRLHGALAEAPCDSVRVGAAAAPVGENGEFDLRFELAEPGYHTLDCGAATRLFLVPGDSLRVSQAETESGGTLRFSGRGSEVNDFLAELAAIEREQGEQIRATYYELASQAEVAFTSGLDSLQQVVQAPLEEFLASHAVDETFAKFERARVRYGWAEGRLVYPNVHRQISGDYSMEVSEGFDDFLSRLDLNDPELLTLDEYTSFLSTHVQLRARDTLEVDRSFQTGDNRTTRARYAVALKIHTDASVRCHVLHSVIINHIDRFGSKGLDELVQSFSQDCNDEELIQRVNESFAEDRSHWDGHVVETYKTIDAASLDAHIFYPAEHQPGDRRPAFVWFHGGGWNEGAWYWCHGHCEHFASQGMVVIAAEYRLKPRHGSTPLESVADAKSLIRWLRVNADRLGIDPARIVASGFSAGGHLAASAAMLDALDEPAEDASVSSAPDAIVLYSSCVDPTGDPWYRQVLAGRAALDEGSPAHHIGPGLPPTIILHGTDDPNCRFASVERFAEAMQRAGNRCELHRFEGRGHYFPLRNRADRQETWRLVEEFLAALGILEG